MAEHRYTNRLASESSPYLLQHAHNPVDWYPWGEEALARARAEHKPILLSIGYSACHWCHVMESESFENEAIARIMNDRFICIKVDREERPDLDQVYQTVCQLLTRQGGWPLTMFLTPDLQPFWGGTYFPPTDRYGRPGFPRILEALSAHYHEEPGRVTEAASEIQHALETLNRTEATGEEPREDLLEVSARALARAYDPENGGFGSQPKFPNTMALEIFLRHWRHSGAAEFLSMVTHTLRKMAEGGIYDQLGGGFHRYSTDSHWLVPHFEKMLYDNALLSRSYVEAYQASRDPFFARVARETLDYVSREMTSPEGGFYSTQDADSEGIEGKFFVWTAEEIEAVLGSSKATLFCRRYGVTTSGNFEHGTSILHIATPLEEAAKAAGMDRGAAEEAIDGARKALLAVREKRVHPFLDDKILTSWNGLMISAFAAAGRVFDEPADIAAAERAASFVLDRLFYEEPASSVAVGADAPASRSAARLRRVIRAGNASGDGFLDDYAYFAAGLLDLYEATGTHRWLDAAARLAESMIELFQDPASGDFYLTRAGRNDLIVRPRQNSDQSIPSPVSVAAMVLLKLSSVLERPELRDRAQRVFTANRAEMEENPHGLGSLICAYDFYLNGPIEVVLRLEQTAAVAPDGLRHFQEQYLPNVVVIRPRDGEPEPPAAAGKSALPAELTAYVCRNFTCGRPLTSWESLEAEITG